MASVSPTALSEPEDRMSGSGQPIVQARISQFRRVADLPEILNPVEVDFLYFYHLSFGLIIGFVKLLRV